MIATTAEKKVQRSQRSYGNHSPAIAAIVATTIPEIDLSSISAIVAIVAIIWKPLSSDRSDCSDNDPWDRPQFYLSDRGDSSDHMETTLQLAIAATAKVPGCIAYAHAFQDGCQHKHWESKGLGTFYGRSTKNDCLYNQFSKEYREEDKKINCWKAIGEKFD